MKIRKFISIALCLSMLLCLGTGCSENNTQEESTMQTAETTITTTETTEKEIPVAVVNDSYYAVTVDGNTVNKDEGTVYRGLGVVTGNNSSRLLMDYKTENPDAYWEIMNLLFKKDYGAGLTHVKIEFGTDVNSSSGTEPSIMRSASQETVLH